MVFETSLEPSGGTVDGEDVRPLAVVLALRSAGNGLHKVVVGAVLGDEIQELAGKRPKRVAKAFHADKRTCQRGC
jgi:hypothetical protein